MVNDRWPEWGNGDRYRWVALAAVVVFVLLGISGVAAQNVGLEYVGFALAALAVLFWFLHRHRTRFMARELRRFPLVGVLEDGGNWRQRYTANWAADRFPPSRWRRYALAFTLIAMVYIAIPSLPIWLRAVGGAMFCGAAATCFARSVRSRPR